jgi:hypothetical protein
MKTLRRGMKTLRRVSWGNAVYFVATLFVVIVFVGVVGYAIYEAPSDPHFVYSATIEISGTGHFQGDVGTTFNEYTIKGRVSQGSPITIEVPYRRADYVSAYARWADGSEGTTKIVVGCKTVAERTTHVVMWKVPRSWEEGIPPKNWLKCKAAKHD